MLAAEKTRLKQEKTTYIRGSCVRMQGGRQHVPLSFPERS